MGPGTVCDELYRANVRRQVIYLFSLVSRNKSFDRCALAMSTFPHDATFEKKSIV